MPETPALPSAWAPFTEQRDAQTGLVFLEDSHTYLLDGRPLPSVTEILQAVGLVDFSHVPLETRERSKARGTRVHKAALYLIEGSLDESSVDEFDRGFVDSLAALLTDPNADLEVIQEEAERPRMHQVYRFAGTPDAPGFWRGQPAVADWCVGPLQESGKPWQLSFYAEMLRHAPCQAWFGFRQTDPIARIGVRLRKDGKFPLFEHYTDPSDWRVCLAALTIFNTQVKLGLRRL